MTTLPALTTYLAPAMLVCIGILLGTILIEFRERKWWRLVNAIRTNGLVASVEVDDAHPDTIDVEADPVPPETPPEPFQGLKNTMLGNSATSAPKERAKKPKKAPRRPIPKRKLADGTVVPEGIDLRTAHGRRWLAKHRNRVIGGKKAAATRALVAAKKLAKAVVEEQQVKIDRRKLPRTPEQIAKLKASLAKARAVKARKSFANANPDLPTFEKLTATP